MKSWSVVSTHVSGVLGARSSINLISFNMMYKGLKSNVDVVKVALQAYLNMLKTLASDNFVYVRNVGIMNAVVGRT